MMCTIWKVSITMRISFDEMSAAHFQRVLGTHEKNPTIHPEGLTWTRGPTVIAFTSFISTGLFRIIYSLFFYKMQPNYKSGVQMPPIRPINALKIVVCFRVLVLFALDFILNGSFMYWIIAFNESSSKAVIRSLNLLNDTTAQQPIFASTSPLLSAWDILTLSERETIYAIWSSLSWTSYFKFIFVYAASIAVGIFFLIARFNDIMSFVSLFFPTVLLIWSSQLNTLCETVSQSDKIFDGNNKFLNFSAKTFFLLAMILYGWKASKIYFKRRFSSFQSANFGRFWRLLIRATFYIPIWSLLNISILERIIIRTRHLYLLAFCIEMTYICKISLVSSFSVRQRLLQIYNDILNDGLQEYVTSFWHRLKVPLLFRIFFLTKLTLLVAIYAVKLYTSKDRSTLVGGSVLDENLLSGGTISPTLFRLSVDFSRYLIVRSCETFVSLCASTTLVSAIGNEFFAAFKFFLNSGQDNLVAHMDLEEDSQDTSALTGILFIVLCLQSSITSLPVNKRLAKLYRNIWLLLMALLHVFQSVTDKILNRLMAAGDFRFFRHIRPVLATLFIIVVPFTFLFAVWSTFGDQMFNPWILSVALFAVELIFKVMNTLIIYSVTLIDVQILNFNAQTEVVIDYLQICGSCIEFLFGTLLFFNGLWILFFDQGGLLRSIMIGIHAYFNIYQQVVRGWESLKRRNRCSKTLDSLRNASQAEIDDHDDVCPICFQRLYEGLTKITNCGHYYHTFCIKKLLHRQDKCPLCHRLLTQVL